MPTLMIVDDSNIIRNRIERIQESSHEFDIEIVAKARNGREAVRCCEQFKPDLATMDLTMPEMDGLTCIAELKKIHPDIRILVVSALSDKATAIQALARGAQGFLRKPFSEEELIVALKKVNNAPRKKRA